MELGDLLLLRKKRKQWALKKKIIMEFMDGIRCPYRTGNPSRLTVIQLMHLQLKIEDLQNFLGDEN